MEIPDILVVDDDTVVIQMMATHLKSFGRLRFATDGERALQLMREAPPDLVLLDAQMPGFSGFELLDRKREHGALVDIPVIMVTSLADAAHEQIGLEKGAADFLAKPVNPAILKARVQTQLRLTFANRKLKEASLLDRLSLNEALKDLRASHSRMEITLRDLAESNERLSHFVRIASHDLREPLNTVAQFAGLIEEDDGPRLSADGQHYLRLVRKAASRMRTLLDDVVNYAQLDSGLQPDMARVSLQNLMDDLKAALAARLEETRATLVVDPLPDATGHASLLAVVFQNLLSNGLKFVAKDQPPEIRVTARESDDEIVIEFQDNGIGIPAEEHERIFQPFVRLHRKNEFDGSGLGLARARLIAEAHGGSLTVVPGPSQETGTTFKLVLPRKSPTG